MLENYDFRYNVYYGGRGSGKSKFVLQKLLLKGLKEKRLILLMRKETNKIRDSLWREITSLIDEWQLSQFFEINKSEFRATCTINGTEFKCLGLDEAEKIKGFADVSDILLDEVTAFTQEDIELIDGTLRSNKYDLPLQMYFTFNPISKQNFVYKYWGFDTGKTPPDTFICHSTYRDNPFLDESYHKRMEALKERNSTRYKIEAEGLFANLSRLVFNNYTVKEFDYTQLNGDLCIGQDYGFVADPTTLVASIVTADTIYIFKEWGGTGYTNDKIANVIKSLGFAKSMIIGDCAEPKTLEELRRAGISRIKPSVKGADSIKHGLQRLMQYDIIVHPDCQGIITEFENYTYKKDRATGEYIDQPIDDFNHYIDALRYSLQCLDHKQKMGTMSKTLLGI